MSKKGNQPSIKTFFSGPPAPSAAAVSVQSELASSADCVNSERRNSHETERAHSPATGNRSFQPHWKDRYQWLRYDPDKCVVFCETCELAFNNNMPVPKTSRDLAGYDAFVKVGYCKWKKAYLRSTMSQQRLKHLAILNCHGPIAENLNLNAIIDEFILKNDVRKNTFAL